ncbi:type IV secretory pathway VirB2 component (pilin) [Saonia flava]|uniref:Type IV secretory pathway VirB2 component (Pilin) n=1 Tax=Saonia flava TaxID=523696 RepID=A0A846R6F7_9FLAO|nr:hypothetical protein [Saonia flava]NJB72359.1 type IV secretory pathway VirB2 component (pilin) [Saonia flava]
MKTKRAIYFILIVLGAITIGFGKAFVQKEYAFSVGIVLLMFGIYKSSQAWSIINSDNEQGEDE